jgi:hypothetical protein
MRWKYMILSVVVVLLIVSFLAAFWLWFGIHIIDLPVRVLANILILGILLAMCPLFLFHNPYEDGVICVYDSYHQPKRWVRYGWHVKHLGDKISRLSCPIPNVEHIAHLNWQHFHPVSGSIHIKAKVVVVVGHRLVDVDRACCGYSDFPLLEMHIGDVIISNLTDSEGEDRLINIGRSQHDTQIQLERWINRSLLGTGWYLVRVEVELYPANLTMEA